MPAAPLGHFDQTDALVSHRRDAAVKMLVVLMSLKVSKTDSITAICNDTTGHEGGNSIFKMN